MKRNPATNFDLSTVRLRALQNMQAQLGIRPVESTLTDPDHLSGPLSLAQERLWLADQIQPMDGSRNVAINIEINGQLYINAFQAAWDLIVTRHEILRTVFENRSGELVQTVVPAKSALLSIVDLSGLLTDQKQIAESIMNSEVERPFVITGQCLHRLTFLRVNVRTHFLLLTMHHIIIDGWSLALLMEELATLYVAITRGQGIPEARPAVRYIDFARWQRCESQRGMLTQHLEHWKRTLAGTSHLWPDVTQSGDGTDALVPNVHSWSISTELSRELRQLGKQKQLTDFMVLLTAVYIMLYRRTGKTDIAVATLVANRSHIELEKTLGFFVNIVILRIKLSEKLTVSEVLAQVRDVCLTAYEHQSLPFQTLVEALRPQRGTSLLPFAQFAFILHNLPVRQFTLPELTLKIIPVVRSRLQVDFSLSMYYGADCLTGVCVSNPDRFRLQSVLRMTENLKTIFRLLLDNNNLTISELVDGVRKAENTRLAELTDQLKAKFSKAERLEQKETKVIRVSTGS